MIAEIMLCPLDIGRFLVKLITTVVAIYFHFMLLFCRDTASIRLLTL
jgi:hypothetical protein